MFFAISSIYILLKIYVKNYKEIILFDAFAIVFFLGNSVKCKNILAKLFFFIKFMSIISL